jgi:hypothetical protein
MSEWLSRDLSVTRTAEILGLLGLLHDDRVPSFTALVQHGSRSCRRRSPPMCALAAQPRRRRARSRPRNEHTVRQDLNRVHPLQEWAGCYDHLREQVPLFLAPPFTSAVDNPASERNIYVSRWYIGPVSPK